MRPYLSPFKFAWDEGNSAGVIVGRVGPCTIVRGTGADEGSWFARGKGQTRRFDSRQAAYDWAKSHGTDSGVENMRRFKTQDCGMDAEPEKKRYIVKYYNPITKTQTSTAVMAQSEQEAKSKAQERLQSFVKILGVELAQDSKPADYVKYAARKALED